MAGRKRVRIDDDEAPKKNLYFVSDDKKIDFIPSGCTGLDCILGGGWALGRVGNLVGDKSTSKTALGTEALINFCRAYPEGRAGYREAEAAYDMDYAAAMGAPIDEIDFGDPDDPITTVEQFAKDFDNFLEKRISKNEPGLYVLDSMDSLSDDAEQKRNVGDATYGMAKAKALSEMFRKLARKQEQARTHLLIISQIRENIGAMFGEKYKRAGGKALDFYASQVVWLAHTGKLKRTIKGVERTYGISVKASCRKNKVGFAFRDFEFDFLFGYGVDDVTACAEWLKKVKRLRDIDVDDTPKAFKGYLSDLEDMSDTDYRAEGERLAKVVKAVWAEIETEFLPKRSKYA